MKKALAGLTAAALGITMMASAQSTKLSACFVYVGPIGDVGWTFAHNDARLLSEKAIPGLETKYVESVPEGNALPVIDRFVSQGCKVIFTTSFGFMDQTLDAAKKYPDVIFAHASGFKRAPNMLTYMADFYEIYYLNGMMAGALSKSGKLGYVAAFPIPELKRHISAFALGARAVNPKATVNVKWINAWFDPAKAKEATEALIAEGNDIMAFTEDTATVVQVAGRKGIPSFGHYNPMLKYAPDHVISGQIVHWEKIYIDVLKKVQSGVYNTKNLSNVDYWYLLRDKAVELGADDGVLVNPKFVDGLKKVNVKVGTKTMSVYDRVVQLNSNLSSAKPTFHPFQGPIRDRKGILRIPAGRAASVLELNTMQWVSQGVVGEVADEPAK
jgi:basic membrane protein A and related proteins